MTDAPIITQDMLAEQWRSLGRQIDQLAVSIERFQPMMVRITRAEVLDEIAEALADACDLDVTWHRYAEAALAALEQHGLRFTELPDAEPDR